MVTESFYKDVIKFADSTDIYGWNRSTDLFLINWWCRMRSYQVNFVHESDHQAGFVIGMRTMGLVYKNLHWLVVEPPSWKIWVRQWEGWHPNIMEKKNHLWNHQPVQNWMILFVQMLVYVCINIPAPWWAVIWELRVLSWILQQFSWGRLTGNPGFCGNWFPFSKCSQKHPTLGFLGCK